MRVLLTGATGFIGSHMARRLLREGCSVTALVRPGADLRRIADLRGEIDLLEGHLEEAAALRSQVEAVAPELCFHLAWYAVPGKYLNALENVACVTGSIALLEALNAAGCPRVVAGGTCFEYDTRVGYLAEDSPLRPQSMYAASKRALHLMAEQYQQIHGRSLAWARIFYLYGPWEDERRLAPLVIRRLLAGEACPLSSGEQIRDFLHVEDVADALWTVARSDIEGPVNIGSSQPLSVAALTRQIAALLERPELLQLGATPRPPGDPQFICANTDRLQRETGWKPRYDLRSGLEATIDWWRGQREPAPGPSA